MVLSIFDLEEYTRLIDIQPLKKINRVDGYDYYLNGHRLGIGTQDPIAECDVRGTVRCIELLMVSDRRQKENVEAVDPSECAAAVQRLSVFRYDLKASARGATGVSAADAPAKLGFMAQDVEQVLPGAVVSGSDGVKTVDVVQLLAAVVGSLKALTERVERVERLRIFSAEE